MARLDRCDAQARFDALYRATRADLLAYLVRRTADEHDAADALAETYLIAWEKLEAVPVGNDARLWLFGVARNIFLRGLKRRRAGDALVERLAGELRTVDRVYKSSAHPARPTLEAALASLNERDREVLTLTAWEGLSPREIATVLGTSANLVRVRLHRTRRHLQRELAGQRESPTDLPSFTRESEC